MGYWDSTPSGWGRSKPLTKVQIRKMQQAFKDADMITTEIRKKEQEEQEQIHQKITDELNMI